MATSKKPANKKATKKKDTPPKKLAKKIEKPRPAKKAVKKVITRKGVAIKPGSVPESAESRSLPAPPVSAPPPPVLIPAPAVEIAPEDLIVEACGPGKRCKQKPNGSFIRQNFVSGRWVQVGGTTFPTLAACKRACQG